MQFRSDIQILRGLSVVLVVLYHLRVQGFNSGFLGVDIFFVISGFLMAVLYDKDRKLAFILRRVQRLLPTYWAIVGGTLAAAFVIVTPNEFKQVTSQAVYSVLYSSNIGFWIQNSYFSEEEFKPLLHFWSLGVELQFYLIVPVIAWLLSKNKIWLPLLIVTSCCLCILVAGISQKTAFFIMPFRLWEFLIGYCAAIYFTNGGEIRIQHKTTLALIALGVLLCIPIMNVNGGPNVSIIDGRHPGLHALIVSIATATLLVFGLPLSITASKIGKFFAYIGNYSYSIYLVHFPIIVLYLYSPLSVTILRPSSPVDSLAIVSLTIVLSLFSYHFIESRSKAIKPRYFLLLIPCLLLVLSIMSPPYQSERFPIEQQHVFNAFEDRSQYRCGKLFRLLNPTAATCKITSAIDSPTKKMMLIGNSHADAIKSTFSDVASAHAIDVFFLVSNDPLMGGGLSPEDILHQSQVNNIETLVLHFSPSAIDIQAIERLVSLAESVDKSVLLIEPVPMWGQHIPKAMYLNYTENKDIPSQTLDDYKSEHRILFDNLDKITARNFKRVSPAGYFCDLECAYSSPTGKPYYFDNGHLTLSGSEILKGLFTEIIEKY
jgi:peptidoglycan/LPS O-acetylase OafA/YrhL